MRITVIGTGYVGLVAGACFADMGNEVICIDTNIEKIEKLKNAIIPIFEPNLEELVRSNVELNRLKFSTDLEYAVKNSKVCFIAVGTPQKEDGSADLSAVFEVSERIAKAMNEYKLIVNKSTSPIGTVEKIKDIVCQNTEYEFDVVSNPEFLKQGNAVNDFLFPERVIIGADSNRAFNIMEEIYSSFLKTSNRIIQMDSKSAEMTKYAANCFLATKISYMNEIANLCEKVGADIDKVRIGISTDSRIGNKFLFPGIGFGGSCFPKDIEALIKVGEENGYEMSIIKSVRDTNEKQKDLFVQKIFDKFGENLTGKTFAIWGLAFKPKTNDIRRAPSIDIINNLLKQGAKIKAYDPKAIDSAKQIFGNKIEYCQNAYETVENADCLLLLTEWNEFRKPDFERIASLMKAKIIFDGRNQYDKEKLKELSFEYFSIGR